MHQQTDPGAYENTTIYCNNELVEDRIKLLMAKRVQAVDVINQSVSPQYSKGDQV